MTELLKIFESKRQRSLLIHKQRRTEMTFLLIALAVAATSYAPIKITSIADVERVMRSTSL